MIKEVLALTFQTQQSDSASEPLNQHSTLLLARVNSLVF